DTTSSMTLTIAPQPTGSAGANGSICAGATYPLSASTAANYSTLHWTTAGDGSFSDNTTLHPVYTPATQDKQAGTVKLTLTVNPVSTECVAVTSDMNVAIHANPVVSLGADKTVWADSTVTLDATTAGVASYHWYPSGATTATIHIDTIGKGLGKQTIWVVVTNDFTCTGTDTINVTFNKHLEGIESLQNTSFNIFPNPNNGKFIIEVKPVHKEILTLRMISVTGETVLSLPAMEVSGDFTRTIDATNLSQGSYFVELSNGKESIMKKILITK
ncbi:MAG: T9SS type A sorting domain-containing protein, partial [Bacteroidota bacterium]